MRSSFFRPNIVFPHYPNAALTTSLALDVRLKQVIQYANEHELPNLLDEVMSHGAMLNHPNCYDANALVIAVYANRHHAISSLMARGALIPPLQNSTATNLLMEACQMGYVDTARELIEVAKIDVDAIDMTGKTALHYAVIEGFAEVTELLLNCGADPNFAARHLHHEELRNIFGNDSSLWGEPVTPLMIAIQCGHKALTACLLESGANPNLGACSPLILAAMLDQPDIFKSLLQHHATLRKCADGQGNEGLSACIASGMKVDYLYQLVSEHDFSDDDGSVHSPLGVAVQKNMPDVCALLLACEAPVEYQDETEEPFTIWQEALPQGRFASPIATLLTASRSASIPSNNPDDIAKLFLGLLNDIQNPTLLASKGFFTSLLFESSLKLQVLSRQSQHLTPRQLALSVAHTLLGNLPTAPLPEPLADGKKISMAATWQKKTSEATHRQRTALEQACTKLIDDSEQQLQHTMTLAFFLSCHADCPDQIDIRHFIYERVCQTSGMPSSLAKKVSDAWNKAAKWTQDWQVAPDSEEDGNRFLLVLMRNLLRKAHEESVPAQDALELESRAVLDRILPQAALPLNQFCSDPAKWLRRYEQRNSLADPDDNLPFELQIALGLPVSSCQTIVTAWGHSIRRARDGGWKTPEELQRVLNKQFAIQLNLVFPDETGSKIVSNIGKLMLETWCTRTMNPSTVRQISRKRHATEEAPEAPPAKVGRIEEPGRVLRGETDD